ncbi:MAG: DUF6414 family protein [Pseudonocardiaceae bacterium]
MILREFLYVDTDKVRGMQAQLDGGIAEEEHQTNKSDKKTEVGPKSIGAHSRGWSEESYVQKSLGDALFQVLEETLYSQGLLRDLSDELSNPAFWYSDNLREEVPPGTLVRITSTGSLFDARYAASILAGFGTTYSGLQQLGTIPTTSKKPPAGKPRDPKTTSTANGINQPEDLIPEFGPASQTTDGHDVDAKFFRSIVKVARGMFTPGLHLNLSPTNEDQLVIGARLQEGRRFLDSETEILFARYGVGKQLWTLVGSIGHYARPEDMLQPKNLSLIDDENRVIRVRFANYINSYMRFAGSLGFADVPQYPSFSVVPLAVYRSIPRLTPAELAKVTQ